MEVTVYVVNFFMGVNRTNEKSCLSRRTRDFGICKGNFFCLDSDSSGRKFCQSQNHCNANSDLHARKNPSEQSSIKSNFQR